MLQNQIESFPTAQSVINGLSSEDCGPCHARALLLVETCTKTALNVVIIICIS